MGILNITPDSFFDGGKYKDEKSILEQVEKMLTEGFVEGKVSGFLFDLCLGRRKKAVNALALVLYTATNQ